MEFNDVLVLGNGESRTCLELKSFLFNGIVVGCNAIYRDYGVDHLICCDRRMAIEAVSNAPKSTTIYTRERWVELLNRFPNLIAVPPLPYTGTEREDDPFQWGSGGYALLVGCLLSDNISIVGFDLWSKDSKVNNVYKGTQHYSSKDSNAVDPNYWIYQIGKIFQSFPNKRFTIYNNKDWKLPDRWKFDNVAVKDITLFVSEHDQRRNLC